MILYIILFSAFAWSTSKCEPPVNSYLPPPTGNAGSTSSQYRPSEIRSNSRSGNSMTNQRQNQPQDSYSLPGLSDSSIPLDTQYGPPSGRSSEQGFARPQFGSPSQSDFQAPRNNNEPSKLYGEPNGARGQGNGPLEQAGQSSSPFNGVNERNNGFGNSEPNSRSNGFSPSNSGFGKQPDSSYGPPPSGDVRPGNGGHSNQGSQAQHQSSFSAPLRNDDASSYNEKSPLRGLSSSYGTPGFSNGSGDRGTGDSGSNFGDESGEPAKYEFSYNVDDAQSGTKFGHSEQRDGNTATGQYNVELPDGRKQVVEYEAGLQGYKPQIRYEGGRNGATGGFGNGNNRPQGGSGGYPKATPGDSSNDIGYSESGRDSGPGKYQQAGDYNQGGLGPNDQEFMGYPRGGPGSISRNEQQSSGYPGDGPRPSRFEAQPHYPSGNDDNESLKGGARGGRPFPNANNENSEGYPRGGPQERNGNSQGHNRQFSNEGISGPTRGQPSRGASGNDRNSGEEGYPRGGPSGPRGTGY